MLIRYIINNKLLHKNYLYSWNIWRCYSEDSQTIEELKQKPTKLGYAKAFDKFEALTSKESEKPLTFRQLLMSSKFIDLGDPEGKVVIGKIFHVVNDDLYVDFGWKFHCICPRPKTNANSYVRGAKVRLMIKDLELSSKFLGSERDLTLLEADCILLGLLQDRNIKNV